MLISRTYADYERVAIEIDGPIHFAYKSNRFLGHSVMKTRHLSLLGWRVIRVSSSLYQNCILPFSKLNFILYPDPVLRME